MGCKCRWGGERRREETESLKGRPLVHLRLPAHGVGTVWELSKSLLHKHWVLQCLPVGIPICLHTYMWQITAKCDYISFLFIYNLYY